MTPRTIKSCIIAAACLVAAAASTATADSIFVTTGQDGAQVQVDTNHTQHWTYTLNGTADDVTGGLFKMKRGSNTTDNITFSLFQGTFADYGTATNLISVTHTPSAFTQSFQYVEFAAASPITLSPGTYTAVLSSPAADVQSRAYFIKGGGTTPLYFADNTGTEVVIPADETVVAVPNPAAAAAGPVLLGLLAAKRRRRQA